MDVEQEIVDVDKALIALVSKASANSSFERMKKIKSFLEDWGAIKGSLRQKMKELC